MPKENSIFFLYINYNVNGAEAKICPDINLQLLKNCLLQYFPLSLKEKKNKYFQIKFHKTKNY